MIKKLVKKLILLTEGKSQEEREKILKEFLRFLKEKNRLYLLPEILKELKKEEGKRKVELIFARSFNEQFLEKIKKKIKEIFGEKEIEMKIDPQIIGGFLAKDENYLLDLSIKGILQKIKKKIYGYL